MPKETNLEFKVGLFVLLGIVALTIFIFSISDSSLFEESKSIKVIFNFTNGLKKSAPVRVAGVDQGLVKSISLFFDRQESKTKVEVELRIKQEVQLPVDSVVLINQLGLLGEKYVEITPGLDTKQFVEQGAVIVGKDPISQEAIAEKVMNVAGRLDSAIGGVDQIIRDEQNVASIRDTLSNLSQLTGGVNDIVNNVKAAQGTVGKLFYDERLYDDMEGLMADLKANPWKLLYRPKTTSK